MQLTLNEEQIALRDALERLAGDAARQKSDVATLWRALADAGWLGLALPEAHGGFGGSALDAGLLARAFGYRNLYPPFFSSIMLGACALACAPPGSCQHIMDSVLRGETLLALAHQEADCFDPMPPRARARQTAAGLILQGEKRASLGAPGADFLIVSATLDDEAALFLLPREHSGVHVRPYRTADGQQAGDVVLDAAVPADALVAHGAGLGECLAQVVDAAITAMCWDAAGAMRALFEQTRDYTAVRKQFGRAVGEFQVVQHRLAEMAVCCEEAQAAAELAALKQSSDASSRRRATSAAKLRTANAARYVAHEAVQLHGAIGTTEELAVAGYFRRLLAFQTTLGSARLHALRHGAAVLPGRAHAASAVLP